MGRVSQLADTAIYYFCDKYFISKILGRSFGPHGPDNRVTLTVIPDYRERQTVLVSSAEIRSYFSRDHIPAISQCRRCKRPTCVLRTSDISCAIFVINRTDRIFRHSAGLCAHRQHVSQHNSMRSRCASMIGRSAGWMACRIRRLALTPL